MVEHRHQRREVDDDRQDLDQEDKPPGPARVEEFAAEDERDALVGERDHPGDAEGQPLEDRDNGREGEQQQGEGELETDAADDEAQREPAFVLADRPCERDEDDDPEQPGEVRHAVLRLARAGGRTPGLGPTRAETADQPSGTRGRLPCTDPAQA